MRDSFVNFYAAYKANDLTLSNFFMGDKMTIGGELHRAVCNYFLNFQIYKLNIPHPDVANILIIAIFFFVVFLTTTRDISASTSILSRLHTEQLKGLAIFFVVLGHLWVHVSKRPASIILSGDAVSMFLILSGFGLTISSEHKKLSFANFCTKRIKRVLIPYWVSTLLIISLDYFLLKRTLPIGTIALTIMGINLQSELTNLDYVRWFVTFILVWYVIFFVAYTQLNTSEFIFSMLAFALLIIPINYYRFHFILYQFFSFPAGCICAVYYKKILRINLTNRKLILLSVCGLFYALLYKLCMANVHIHDTVFSHIPNILIKYIQEYNSLLINFSVIILTAILLLKGFSSNFLLFLGKYSYEIFLLHAVFLIKYNPIIKNTEILALIAEFYLLLAVVVALAILLFKFSSFRPLLR